MKEKKNEISITEILDKLIEIADMNNDEDLKKWAHLESEGYYKSNKYLSEEDVVPQYREVAGEHRDSYDRPIIITDPKLSLINTTRLRHSAAELDGLSRRREGPLSMKDPELSKSIKENLGITVTKFVFNPASLDAVINSIKQEAIRRSKKYISRRELMSTEMVQKSNERVIPQNVTLSWLWKHIPASWWWRLAGFMVIFFGFGISVSGIPQVKNLLRHIPGYKVDLILPQNTAKNIEEQLTKLIESHSSRLSKLYNELLEKERFISDPKIFLSFERERHKEGAKRIRELIREEDKRFQDEINSIKSFIR